MRTVLSIRSMAGVSYAVTMLKPLRSTFSLAGFSYHFFSRAGPHRAATSTNPVFWLLVRPFPEADDCGRFAATRSRLIGCPTAIEMVRGRPRVEEQEDGKTSLDGPV